MYCSANLRYELLADELRRAELPSLDVLELDPASPLRPLLRSAKVHQRTYYSPTDQPGTTGSDGARCEDITQLTFPDNSFDVIISSDVLEHVFDLQAAFKETLRVLRPGGMHLFTVPPRAATRQRAVLDNGQIRHLVAPEYHLDPVGEKPVLATWDIGPDLANAIDVPELELSIVRGPVGRDQRVAWRAMKRLNDGNQP